MLAKSLFRKPRIELENQGKPSQSSPEGESAVSCPVCKRSILKEELSSSQFVCAKCNHHFKLSARQRIAFILDEGSFTELDGDLESRNLLNFPDYDEKLRQAKQQSGEKEAILTGAGKISGQPCAFFAMEPSFMMGSMGSIVGEKLTRLFEYAADHHLPVIGYAVSGGARVQEGVLSLMQMAKVSGAVRKHSDLGNVYIVILTDPTTGGVAASFAMEADIILAEPKALIGFAGPRVIEQTTRQKLPEGFQRAEFQLQKGFVDRIAPRNEQKELLSQLLAMHTRRDALDRL